MIIFLITIMGTLPKTTCNGKVWKLVGLNSKDILKHWGSFIICLILNNRITVTLKIVLNNKI